MDNKYYSILLYNSLSDNYVKNKINIVTNLFKIDRSTFFLWKSKYNGAGVFLHIHFLFIKFKYHLFVYIPLHKIITLIL